MISARHRHKMYLRWWFCALMLIPLSTACGPLPCQTDNECPGSLCDVSIGACLPTGMRCIPGNARPCYTGVTTLAGKGACRFGQQRCEQQGQWGKCIGAQLPTKETCDGIDNDCDGTIDEGCAKAAFCRAQQLNKLLTIQTLYQSRTPKRISFTLTLNGDVAWTDLPQFTISPASWSIVSTKQKDKTQLHIVIEGTTWPSSFGLKATLSLRFPAHDCALVWTSPPLQPGCEDNKVTCENGCSSLEDDPMHCGKCGNACATGLLCQKGICKGTCDVGRTWCRDSCVSLIDNDEHCGACNNPCTGGQYCAKDRCAKAKACVPPLVFCRGECVNLQKDTEHCGGCAKACGKDQRCQAAKCLTNQRNCKPEEKLCGQQCTDTTRDTKHCGKCGVQCAVGQACVNGSCKTCQSCPAHLTTWPIQIQHIGIDDKNNIYVAGTYQQRIHIAGQSIAPIGKRELIVLKLNPKGTLLWMKKAPGTSITDDVECNDMHVTPAGDIYVTGGYRGAITFGNKEYKDKGDVDFFLVKMTTDGNWAWSLSWWSQKYDAGKYVRVDPKGAVFVAVTTQSSLKIEGQNSAHYGSKARHNKWLFKVSSSGALLWQYHFKTVNVGKLGGLEIDSKGNAYLAGAFQGKLWPANGIILDAKGGYVTFLLSFAPDGSPRWGRVLGQLSEVVPVGLVVANNDRVSVTGTFTAPISTKNGVTTPFGGKDIYIAQWDSKGDFQWLTSGGAHFTDQPHHMTAGDKGELHLTGQSELRLRLGQISLPQGDSLNYNFVAKISSKGNWSDVQLLHGQFLAPIDIARSKDGTRWLAGTSAPSHLGFGQLYQSTNSNVSVVIADRSTALQCPDKHRLCGACTATEVSKIHCGSCDRRCRSGQLCRRSICEPCTDCAAWLSSGNHTPLQSTVSSSTVHHAISDRSNNVYVVGTFEGTLTLGNVSLSSQDESAWIAKLDPKGQWLWAKNLDTTGKDAGKSIALTDDGDIVWIGHYSAAGTFGGMALKAPTKSTTAIFVCRMSSTGATRWLTTANSPMSDTANAIAISTNGIHIAGQTHSGGQFGNVTLTSLTNDAFAAKLNHAGQWLWATTLNSSNGGEAQAIATDANENVYWGGSFRGKTTRGGDTITSTARDAFVGKLNKTGQPLWLKQMGNPSQDDDLVGLHVKGNTLYTSGHFKGLGQFGTSTLIARGSEDIYVATLDTAGKWGWIWQMGSLTLARLRRLALNTKGELIISGEYKGKADIKTLSFPHYSPGKTSLFALHLTPKGTLLGGLYVGGPGQDQSLAGAWADNQDRVMMAGHTNGHYIRIGEQSYPLLHNTSMSVFVAAFSTTTPCPQMDHELCGTTCYHTNSNDNCGQCGTKCSAGQRCGQGRCR